MSAPEPAVSVLRLRTEIDSESLPAAASIELLARVSAATTVSLPAAAATVALVAPLERCRESAPLAKSTLMSFAVEARTTVSLDESSLDPKPLMEVLPTTLLKVRLLILIIIRHYRNLINKCLACLIMNSMLIS